MTQTLGIPGAGTVGPADHHRPFGLLKELERPGDVFRDLGPNWFAAVMGTGIVAIAAAVLPLRLPGLQVFATVVWALAAAVLIALIRGLERALDPVPRTGPGARRQPGDGAVLGGARRWP